MKDAENEYVLRPYMNTASKNTALQLDLRHCWNAKKLAEERSEVSEITSIEGL